MADRLVPDYSGDVPISGLDVFQSHLHHLELDPSHPPNPKLFDDIELQLTETNTPTLLPTLLPPLTKILKQTSHDPTPLLSLSIKLLHPLSFTNALAVAEPPSLIAALTSPHPGANQLALAILHKASRHPSDAAILSTTPELVEELVRRWLDSPDVGVAERAAKVLGDLLHTDLPRGGHARLWRMVFDRPMLEMVVTLCTGPEREASLAQGRLLRLLTRVAAMDVRAVNRTEFEDLFPLEERVAQVTGRGLLQWAALGMVRGEDRLMRLTRVDFFETFVSVMRVAGRSPEADATVKAVVRAAVEDDEDVREALRSLPDRTVEEEADLLRAYIDEILAP